MTTTNFAQASYQEVIDLHTESGTASVLGLHTPTGESPYKLLKGFFQQFRKYKYTGCRFSLVPASRLPADPLQVSFEAGEPTIDPRDMLNPIMFHGCHGNDMGTILNTLYTQGAGGMFPRYQSDSMEQNIMGSDDGVSSPVSAPADVSDLYYSALVDKTWLKAHPQSGMRKSGLRPLVYSLASNTPLVSSTGASGNSGITGGNNTGAVSGNPDSSGLGTGAIGPTVGSDISSTVTSNPLYVASQPQIPNVYYDESDGFHYQPSWGVNGVNLFTPRLQRLGWLDTYTKSVGTVAEQDVQKNSNGTAQNLFSNSTMRRVVSKLPLVYMGMIMLPPAYKTEQYYRLIIDHQFQFKDFRGISESEYYDMAQNTYFNFNE